KLTIERAAFLKALGHVQSVVERRTTIPILSNVLLRAEPGRLALSATDMDLEIVERVTAHIEREGRTTAPAHTLYDIVRKLREGAAAMPGIIVPRKTVLELRKLVEESEDEVQIGLGETKIRLAVGEAALTSKLIDGTFPDYDRVIPSNNDKTLEVDRKDFAEAVDRVSTISTEKSRAVKLKIEHGSLEISATSPENGKAEEELEARYSAAPLEIGFNSRYLLDIAEQIQGEGVQFELSDAGSP